MRPVDFRLNGVSAEWTGEQNASESVIKVNGTELARNLSTDPKADNDPFIWSGWNGEQGNGPSTKEFIDVDWSDSGRACLFTRPTVVVDSGDVFLRMPETNLFELGKTYTAVFYVRPLFDGARFFAPLVGNSYSHVYRYPPETVDVPKGSIQKFVCSFIADEAIINSRRYMYATIRGCFSGCQYEASMGDIYEGPYDPNRPWFSGDSTPEQLMQSPTIGSPLEGSLEDIAGPLVAEAGSNESILIPNIEDINNCTLITVINEMPSDNSVYVDLVKIGDPNSNSLIIRSTSSRNTVQFRYNVSTLSLFRDVSKTPVAAMSLDVDKSKICGFVDARKVYEADVLSAKGFDRNNFDTKRFVAWAGLWSKALTEDEIAKVTLWLKQRYL